METEITELLRRMRDGDAQATHELLPLVHTELYRIAANYLRKERKDHTLQPTALVNEAYVRLLGTGVLSAADKAHFLAIVSKMMRQVLVDYARNKGSEKRGGGLHRVDDAALLEIQTDRQEVVPLLELDRALDVLAAENPLLAQAIEMRYFGGLTAEEAAEVTGRSVHAIRHDLRFAQAWLRRALVRE